MLNQTDEDMASINLIASNLAEEFSAKDAKDARLELIHSVLELLKERYGKQHANLLFVKKEFDSHLAEGEKEEIKFAFERFTDRSFVLAKMLKGCFNMFDSFYSGTFGLIEYRGVSKNYSFNIGAVPVYLDIRSRLNAEAEEDEEWPLTKVLDSVEDEADEYGFSETVRPADHEEEETAIIDIYARTIRKILQRHPEFLRGSRVNIYVQLGMFEADESSTIGEYFHLKSNSADVFIAFYPDKDMLSAYIQGMEEFLPDSRAYETIVHELAHAFDWMLMSTSDVRRLGSLMRITTDAITPETIVLGELLVKFREEGLTTFTEKIIPKLHAGKPLEFNLSSILDLLADILDVLKAVFKKVLKKEVTEDELEEMIPDSFVYSLGNAICWLIFLNKHKDSGVYNLFKEDSSGRHPLSVSGFKQMLSYEKSFASVFGSGRRKKRGFLVYVSIAQERTAALNQFFTYLSLLTLPTFFIEYFRACKELGFDPAPLTPDYFEKINGVKLDKFRKMMKKSGFET